MPNHVEDPFRCVDAILKEHGGHSPVVIVDMHAEATSEKYAMGWYLDGRVSAVYGTHTHVQTADDRILTKGTAYITDVGMCGPFDSVIGMEKEIVIGGFMSAAAQEVRGRQTNVVLQGVIVEVDQQSGKARRNSPSAYLCRRREQWTMSDVFHNWQLSSAELSRFSGTELVGKLKKGRPYALKRGVRSDRRRICTWATRLLIRKNEAVSGSRS